MSPSKRPRKLPSIKDTIERAIKKGAGLDTEKVNYETVVYEGFAPHKVPVIVECLTDSRNRTAPEIRNLFKAGSLGQPGSVAFFFNHLGVVEATHPDANRDAEADAIEAGAQEIEPLEAEEVPAGQKGARFLTEIKDLDHVSKALKAAGWNVIASEIRYLAKNFVEVSDAARKDVDGFSQRARRPRRRASRLCGDEINSWNLPPIPGPLRTKFKLTPLQLHSDGKERAGTTRQSAANRLGS